MKEKMNDFDKKFRIISIILLSILILTLPVLTIAKNITYQKSIVLLDKYGSDSEKYNNYKVVDIPSSIYEINSILCVLSIISQVVYFSVKFMTEKSKGANLKSTLAKSWPILVLAFFMVWTSVGCIQAGMEMDAEIVIKEAKNIDDVPQRIIDIANWSPTDRMSNTSNIYQNAKDRAWHGCNNLKDGYFSFLFYATVFLNIIMLGNNKPNIKRWILRSFLISTMFMAICNYIAFLSPYSFINVLFNDRSVFNNRNHYGYYISVVVMMSVLMAMTEKNWYFKGLALFNTFLFMPILIICDTFGSYLGVLFGMIFVGIVALIRLISDKRTTEFVFYVICLIPFILCSNGIVRSSTQGYSLKYHYFIINNLDIRFGDTTYRYYVNSLTSELAEEANISGATIGNEPVLWGKHFYDLGYKSNSWVSANFEKVFRDIKTLLNFYEDKYEATKISGENVSGDILVTKVASGEKSSGNVTIQNSTTQVDSGNATTTNIMTQEEYQQKLNEIFAKYSHVSGETMEEYFAVENKMQEEVSKFLTDNDLIDENGNIKKLPSENAGASNSGSTNVDSGAKTESGSNNKSGLSDDVSGIGSGRGEVWIRSLDLMNQRPWFGWGLENILNEFYEQYGINEGRTHNLVLQLGATTGIPGVLLYLVGSISIWLKVLFDAKLRKFDKNGKLIICGAFAALIIIVNLIVNSITDKLLVNGFATVICCAVLYAVIFIKNIRLRIKYWNDLEYIASGVFVSYMISSLFGNSAFYTSPYFMIFLGILAAEMINKKSSFDEEKLVVANVSKEAREVKEQKVDVKVESNKVAAKPAVEVVEKTAKPTNAEKKPTNNMSKQVRKSTNKSKKKNK